MASESKLLKQAIETARKEFGRSSPLRVGLVLGRTWGNFPCPYKPGSNAEWCFMEGFMHSQAKRRRERERRAAAKKDQKG